MTDEEIVKRAKEAEKRTGFGELVHSPILKGVNSAYGIGFIEGMVEYRNSLQEEPVSKDFHKGYIQAIEDACKWLQEHCTYTHPRKGSEECAVNIPRLKNDLLK